jgi:hypothetical protein
MITIAEDNHIPLLHKLSIAETKNALKWDSLVDIEEFKRQVNSGLVSHDESAFWACEHENRIYTGEMVEWELSENDKDEEAVLLLNKPEWATMIYWYGK